MARILKFPFQLAPNGAVATVEQDSEQADREQVAVLALTVAGERPLRVSFGITDPAFAGVTAAEVAAGIAVHGPPVDIHAVTSSIVREGEQLVEISFD